MRSRKCRPPKNTPISSRSEIAFTKFGNMRLRDARIPRAQSPVRPIVRELTSKAVRAPVPPQRLDDIPARCRYTGPLRPIDGELRSDLTPRLQAEAPKCRCATPAAGGWRDPPSV